MRVCRFDGDRVGIVQGEGVHDVTDIVAEAARGEGELGDPLVLALPALRALPTERLQSAAWHPLTDVRLSAPVRRPGKIIAAPVNYRAHAAEANADPGIRYGHTQTDIGEAGLFLKASSSLAGPADGIPIRFPERRTDYEAELVVVVGRTGTDIPRSRALDHVAGYTVGLDVTLRGPEDRSFRKSLDGYSVIGPWLVTADEIPDPDTLQISLHQNGTRRQHASTADMVYGVARLIEFASSFYTLYPGDLLFTGTPEGVGQIQPGDYLVGEVEGVGRLETTARVHIPSGAA
jgi:2-keto-4-pentenoate hydratase/2-oxohepta-3-ene-1,7-dioic acid hydratase in catechol pathway